MKFVDYHIHSTHSCDGKSTILEISQKAIELGIVEIGFSEHVDFDPKDRGFGFFNYDMYTSEIESAQEFYVDKLVIRKGVEIDYQHCFEGNIKKWLRNKTFDFVIGSVHYINHEFINHRLVTRKDLRETYDAYFSEITHSIESDLFDVIGHLDLMSRYIDNRRSELKSFDYEKGMKLILEEIVENKMYLEINSKGLREKYKDMMPRKKMVKEFIDSGGRLISIGSDAHSAEEIGGGIKETVDFLEKCNGKKIKLLFG